MKTVSEIKFDRIIKVGFHEILKPLGFRKKANNFYLQLSDLGQIINVQKSLWGSKDNISFTINTGIFVPEYWSAYYNFIDKRLPDYPTEPECLIRKRIGDLKKQNDTWYDVNEKVDEDLLILDIKESVVDHILPHFERVNSKESLLQFLATEELPISPLGKLIVYGELKQYEKAAAEYERLLKGNFITSFYTTIKEYGQKYKLN